MEFLEFDKKRFSITQSFHFSMQNLEYLTHKPGHHMFVMNSFGTHRFNPIWTACTSLSVMVLEEPESILRCTGVLKPIYLYPAHIPI